MKKFIFMTLTLVALLIVPAYAAESSSFSVTVPSSLPITVDGNGNVITANDVVITNNGSKDVEINSITVRPATGWSIVSESTAASAASDEKKIALSFNGQFCDTGGVVDTASFGTIAAGGSMPLTYDAVIPRSLSGDSGSAASAVIVIGSVKPYLTFTSPSEFSMSVANPGWNDTIEYSTNAVDWTEWDGSSVSALSAGGDFTLYFRGTNNTIITGSDSNSNKWTITGTNVQCHGNIETLLDYVTVEHGGHPSMDLNCYRYMFYGCKSLTTAPALPATTLADNCYRNMFDGCTSLIAAPKLAATTLSAYCYQNMFSGCTSLTTAPELPATTLAGNCYSSMFNGCTSLATAPALPATTLAYRCYSGMFWGCTSLTTAPALPATTLADNCYSSMFNGCTSLATAPALPATTLEDYCYSSMFHGCTSLATAPALPATTLANYCYQEMFAMCTSLTTAPELPATTLAGYCYSSMFHSCKNLTTAPALPATTLANYCYEKMFVSCTSLTTAPALPATTLKWYCYQYMFNSCTSLTTAPKLPAATLAPYCYQYMFSGCTSLTTAPALPATTLANYCYSNMFSGCTSLTTVSALPATTLANYCYQQMFYGCTSLKISKTQDEEYTIAYRIPLSGTGKTANGALTNMFYRTGGKWVPTPTINTTYYLHSSNSIVGNASATSLSLLFDEDTGSIEGYTIEGEAA